MQGWMERRVTMDAVKIIKDANWRVDVGDITIGQYEELIAPLRDVAPVRHGRWIGCDTQCGIACSICGTPVDDFCHSIDYIDLAYKPNYCPNCGARMNEGDGGDGQI